MKRIDRLVLGEIIGPWVFGVAIFTTLIMAGSFLFQLTAYLAKGVDMWTVTKLATLLTPGVMAKTFPMAVLLAALLSFGRLSGESEIVAMRAAGTSLGRIMVPVAIFGAAVSLLAFLITEFLVPQASYSATALKEKIVTQIDGQSVRPTSYPIFEKGKLTGMVAAKNFNIADRALDNVAIVFYDKDEVPNLLLTADRMVFDLTKGKLNPDQGWRVVGKAKLISDKGVTATFTDAWPGSVPRPTFTDQDLLAGDLKDLDSLSMREISRQIENQRKINAPADTVANLEFGYWNKIAIPLAALIYALVGAPLGIRNHRTGAAVGFWLSVIIIFGYLLLTNFMSIWARGGAIPAWLASFLPLGIGLAVALFTIQRKNA
ncbi:MAG: LptF/LptG family permease [Chthonomonas sp.]|nr:LptF/LptG family permease [Chthonomonas sp.]